MSALVADTPAIDLLDDVHTRSRSLLASVGNPIPAEVLSQLKALDGERSEIVAANRERFVADALARRQLVDDAWEFASELILALALAVSTLQRDVTIATTGTVDPKDFALLRRIDPWLPRPDLISADGGASKPLDALLAVRDYVTSRIADRNAAEQTREV